MLEHQEFQSEDDPPDTGDDKPGNKPGEAPTGFRSVFSPPQSPPSPPCSQYTPKDSNDWKGNLKLGIELVGLAALIVYTVFSILQWSQIRWTNRLTREALNDNGTTLEKTLAKQQAQTDATNRLGNFAQQQAGGTTGLVTQATKQNESLREQLLLERKVQSSIYGASIRAEQITVHRFLVNNTVQAVATICNIGKMYPEAIQVAAGISFSAPNRNARRFKSFKPLIAEDFKPFPDDKTCIVQPKYDQSLIIPIQAGSEFLYVWFEIRSKSLGVSAFPETYCGRLKVSKLIQQGYPANPNYKDFYWKDLEPCPGDDTPIP